MKKIFIAFMLASVIMTGCAKSPNMNQSFAPESTDIDAESSVSEETVPATRETRWYDAIDWTQYSNKDTDLFFTSSRAKAPLTLESLIPLTTEFSMNGEDTSGNTVTLKPSDLMSEEYTADEAVIYLNDVLFNMKLYNTDNEPLSNLGDCFSLDTDYSTDLSLFGITDVEVPEDIKFDNNAVSKYKLEKVAKEYGRPSYVVLDKGYEDEWAYIFWQRNGYRFGYFLYDYSDGDEAKPAIAAVAYYSDKAWNRYANDETFKRDKSIHPFDEYIGYEAIPE